MAGGIHSAGSFITIWAPLPIVQEIILRKLRLPDGPALLLLTLLAVLGSLVSDLRGPDARQILASFSLPVPSGSTTDDRLDFFGSPQAQAEEVYEEIDEDAPPLLEIGPRWACLGAEVETAAVVTAACSTGRASSQFATGPPFP